MRGSRANTVLREMRFGRRLVIKAHRRKVLEFAGLLRERVLPLPSPFRAQLFELQALPERLQTKRTRRVLLLLSRLQAERLQERVSKPHIGEPWLVEINPQGKVIELRAFTGPCPADARRKQRDAKLQRPQQCREGTIQLIAKSATPLLDNLADNSRFIHHNGAPKRDIKVLKGNSQQVHTMDRAKSLGCGRRRSGITDAREIGRHIKHG